MSYMKRDFLLQNDYAKKLYFDYAEDMPIFDYHCHLSEKELLADEVFSSIYAVWLKGDHYKWRLMRNFGIAEEYITGNKSEKEKFFAYCKTVGTAFGNPLYHWSQAELAEYFECTAEINEENAEFIWTYCNDYIKKHKLKPSDVIRKSNVRYIFTTNEVFDELSTFGKIKEKFSDFSVFPAFRADKIMNVEADKYLEYLKQLSDCTESIGGLDALERALEKRLMAFIEVGATAADIAVERALPVGDRAEAERAFCDRLSGKRLAQSQIDSFKGYLTYYLMKLYAKHGIATEIHVGAMRNNNSVMLRSLGLDSGYDSISEENSTKNLSRLFDRLVEENAMPKAILFNLNPKMNMELVSLIGCFQGTEAKGKLQYGAAWWFLDNKAGMEKQLSDLASVGHIGAFIGMLTDSRSFLSYPRHKYFRRILCNFFGTLMTDGEITANTVFVGEAVRNICFYNAEKYFFRSE